jgi:hypothetical protein
VILARGTESAEELIFLICREKTANQKTSKLRFHF